MKKEIELKRLKEIDFLELFTYKEIYGNRIKLGKVCSKVENSENLLTYRIKFVDNIMIESYPNMRIMFKELYYDIENSEEVLTDNFKANKKIENYRLKLKLEKNLKEKGIKTGVKKI